jgi:hypothetical protein
MSNFTEAPEPAGDLLSKMGLPGVLAIACAAAALTIALVVGTPTGVSGGELMAASAMSSLVEPRVGAALGFHVRNVVRVCPDRQVCWVYASRVVARVKKFQSVRYRPLSHFVREPMGHEKAWLEIPAHINAAISILVDVSPIRPALTGRTRLDILPETFNRTHWKSHARNIRNEPPSRPA